MEARNPRYTIESATHFLQRPGYRVYYRIESIRFSDGTTGESLEFYSTNFNCWRGSDVRTEDRAEFIASLIKL